jgi:hypothetical protein
MSGLGFGPDSWASTSPTPVVPQPTWSTVSTVPSTGGNGILQNVSNWIGLGLQTYASVERIRRGSGGAVQQIPNAASLAAQRGIGQAGADDPAAIALSTNRGLQGNLNIPPIILYGVGVLLLVKLLGKK